MNKFPKSKIPYYNKIEPSLNKLMLSLDRQTLFPNRSNISIPSILRKKTDKRLKSLTVMLINLETQIDNFEAQIDAHEDECSENNDQMEQQRAAL